MFINSRVVHFKFGPGTITDIEINPKDQLKSKISVSFDSGKVSKFSMDSFGKDSFFKLDDDETVKFIDKLREEKKKNVELINMPEIKYNAVDEFDNIISKQDWEKAARVAGSYRFSEESRAVVVDDTMVFLNATSALKFFNLDTSDYAYVYQKCDANKKNKYKDHTWRYADEDEILAIINMM